MDAARQLAQVVERLREALPDVRQLFGELVVVGRGHRLRARELERQRHQALLDAVVEVALEAPARLVGGGDQPGARGHQLGAGLGVRDRGFEQLREPGHPLFGVGRRRVLALPARRDQPPQPALDDDRGRDARAQASLAGELRQGTLRSLVVLDPGRPPGPPHHCRGALALDAHARADRRSRDIQPAVGEHEDLVAGLEAVQRNLVGVQQRLHLPGHSVEDRGGRAPSATSVATRRSAACSSASRLTSARDSALAIAVATSSVNCRGARSVSGGSGSVSHGDE